jgi:hypothetical protein
VWVNPSTRLSPRRTGLDDETAAELATILPAVRRPGATEGHAVADERYRAHRAVSTLCAGCPMIRPLS